MFYRLLRGFELWALLALMLFASLYFYAESVGSPWFNKVVYSDRVYEEDFGDEHYVIDSENIRQYCFENLGISAFDVYRAQCETLKEPASDILFGSYNCAEEELNLLIALTGALHIIPCILMCVFIPVFFGRMFSDGTLKNLIACGHSKGKIYAASLTLTVLLDLVLFGANLLSLVFWCLIYKWRPPVYLPVVIPEVLIAFLLLVTISAICLAVLFASSKKTTSFVAGFILAVFMLVPGTILAASFLGVSNTYIDPGSEDYTLLKEIVDEKGMNGLEKRFDLSVFAVNFYYEGRELNIYADEFYNHPGLDKVLLAFIYMDPSMVPNFERYESVQIPAYMVVRDGLAAINVASEVFWITVSSGIGYFVFRKREIHC